jgi:hypothetical protein
MATRFTHPNPFELLKSEDPDESSLFSQYDNDGSPARETRKSLEKQDVTNDKLNATPTKNKTHDKEQPTTGKESSNGDEIGASTSDDPSVCWQGSPTKNQTSALEENEESEKSKPDEGETDPPGGISSSVIPSNISSANQ